jgi:hypothetical protein
MRTEIRAKWVRVFRKSDNTQEAKQTPLLKMVWQREDRVVVVSLRPSADDAPVAAQAEYGLAA